MEVKLCTDCGRPMWEGHCLYGKGFLAGITQGRKMVEEEKQKEDVSLISTSPQEDLIKIKNI